MSSKQDACQRRLLKFCTRHNSTFPDVCGDCEQQEIAKLFLSQLTNDKIIQQQIVRLQARRNGYPESTQRNVLIMALRERYGFSWLQIGKLMKRDHTTCMSSYKYALKNYF